MRLYTGCRWEAATQQLIQGRGDAMDFRSRIFANSRGSTIDAVGNGQYLVCHHSSCFKVKGWRRAHEAVKRLEGSSD